MNLDPKSRWLNIELQGFDNEFSCDSKEGNEALIIRLGDSGYTSLDVIMEILNVVDVEMFNDFYNSFYIEHGEMFTHINHTKMGIAYLSSMTDKWTQKTLIRNESLITFLSSVSFLVMDALLDYLHENAPRHVMQQLEAEAAIAIAQHEAKEETFH